MYGRRRRRRNPRRRGEIRPGCRVVASLLACGCFEEHGPTCVSDPLLLFDLLTGATKNRPRRSGVCMFLLKQIERSFCSVVTVALLSLHRHDIELEFRFAHVLRRVRAWGASTCTIPGSIPLSPSCRRRSGARASQRSARARRASSRTAGSRLEHRALLHSLGLSVLPGPVSFASSPAGRGLVALWQALETACKVPGAFPRTRSTGGPIPF